MTKKLFSLIVVAILVLGLATTASAAPVRARVVQANTASSSEYYQGIPGFMCDSNGNLLSREDFEAKLDKAIEDGLIEANDKAAYMDMYDFCATNGGGMGRGYGGAGRGCCAGRW